MDWAASRVTRPAVTFGNSSTSAGVQDGGSNVRRYCTFGDGMEIISNQYMHNNVYMYPEHVDHDPGHNGNPGHGDIYPTNSPYLITSQGSSGSDQPFMRDRSRCPGGAAGPRSRGQAARAGLLAPTPVKMLLRSTNKNVESPEDYLSGKAHPTVFEGSLVQELKMVQAAHELTADKLPPLVN